MFRGKEYIYEIYKEKSFSAAAQKLYITQPALSNTVKRIEDRIGFPIFDRSTSPIQLTEVGKEYIRSAEIILKAEEDFAHYLADTQNLKTGKLSIGGGALLSSYVLPKLIAGFREKFPYVELNIMEGSTPTLERSLADGVLDFLIDKEVITGENFECREYQQEHMILAVPGSWEINGRLAAYQQSLENIITEQFLAPQYPEVPLEQFSEAPFVMLTPESSMYRRAAGVCSRYGFAPKTVLTLDQEMTAYNMTCAGLGASFVSDTLVKGTMPHPNVVYYKLAPEFASQTIYFYYKKNRYIPKCMSEFLGMLDEGSSNSEGAETLLAAKKVDDLRR